MCVYFVRRIAGAGVATISEAWYPRMRASNPFFAAIQTLPINAWVMVSAPAEGH